MNHLKEELFEKLKNWSWKKWSWKFSTFCQFGLWLAKFYLEASIFSDITLIFLNKLFLILWCKSWWKVAHFFCLQKQTIFRKKRGLYYSTNNWKSKNVIKKYGCKLMARGWDMFYEDLYLLSISDHLFYNKSLNFTYLMMTVLSFITRYYSSWSLFLFSIDCPWDNCSLQHHRNFLFNTWTLFFCRIWKWAHKFPLSDKYFHIKIIFS